MREKQYKCWKSGAHLENKGKVAIFKGRKFKRKSSFKKRTIQVQQSGTHLEKQGKTTRVSRIESSSGSSNQAHIWRNKGRRLQEKAVLIESSSGSTIRSPFEEQSEKQYKCWKLEPTKRTKGKQFKCW